jgi:hypothetical protein
VIVTRALRSTCLVGLEGEQPVYQINPAVFPFARLSETFLRVSEFDWREFAVYGEEIAEYFAIAHPLGGINIHNPVAAAFREVKDSLEHRTSKDWLVYGLKSISDLLNKQYHGILTLQQPEAAGRLLRSANSHWNKVDWKTIPTEWLPPYKIRLSDGTDVALSPSVLAEMVGELPAQDGNNGDDVGDD